MAMNTNPDPEGEISEKVQRINPWLGIWVKQRTTLVYVWQQLLEEYIHRLFILLGLAFMLAVRLPDWSSVTPHPIGVMVQILLFAPLGGIMSGYIFAAVLRQVGKWMRRVVPSAHAKCMVAWSNLPLVASLLVFVLVFYLVDRNHAQMKAGHWWLFQGLAGWLPILAAAPVYLWFVVVRIRSIMVLLGIDALRASIAWLTTTLITYVPAAFFIYLYMVLYYISATSGS
jgi:hypothetical protein